MRELREQAIRFLLLGGVNTAATFVALSLLAAVIDPAVAYTVVFAAGLLFTSVMTGRFVFSTEPSAGTIAAFIGWYLTVYAVGLLVVRILDDDGRSTLVLALVTVCVTAPLSFLGGRIVFARSTLAKRGE
jgi:putative flippase GtrA